MKRVFSLFLALLCLIFTCSCADSELTQVKKYSKPSEINVVSSGVVADNDKFRLVWDNKIGNLMLYNKETETVWASTPYEYYSNRGDAANFIDNSLCSSLIITCMDNKNTPYEYYSYDAVFQNGSAYSVKIKNGIRIIYFFDKVGISVPVDYTLTDEGLKAEVLINKITEKGEFKLYKIAVLPFFASTPNNKENYIFVPSGSGALMYADSDNREIRYYSEMVYGEDPSQNFVYEPVNEKRIKLPVYGVKSGDKGVIGIIEDGCGAAYINADVGNVQMGYSNVYACFQVRGADRAVLKSVDNLNITTENITDVITAEEKASVTFIPLENGGDYNKMASAYREYLLKKGTLKGEKSAELYLDILGAAKIKKNFFGVSYDKVSALTTVEQTNEIIEEVINETGINPIVKLKGFGKGGIDYSTVAGGYTLDGCLGSKKELKNLLGKWNQKSVPILMDFDIINYTKSGKGFSISKDTAFTANNVAVKNKSYEIVTHFAKSNVVSPNILSRSNLLEAGEKLIKASNKLGIQGVSLASLGNIAYSDYKQQKYYVKSGMGNDASKIINSLKKDKKIIGTDSANDYAAILSDYISSTPSSSSKYLSLDKDIPFYRMVFKGLVSQSSEPINLAVNPTMEFLDAVSCGIALNFTVAYDFDDSLIYGANSGVSGSVFNDIKKSIFEYHSQAKEVLRAVSSATIESFNETDGVTQTVFSNGVTVYVNKNNKSVETPIGCIEAYSFDFSQKGN